MTPLHLTENVATMQSDPNISIAEWQAMVIIAVLGISFLLALVTAGLAVYRYRRQADSALRALVVGLVLVAVAPLPFRFYVSGTISPAIRELAPSIFQLAGLLAILYAMYGNPRPRAGRLVRDITRSDLAVVSAALAIGLLTSLVGNLFGPSPIALAGVSIVVTIGMFVTGQALRAAVRYRSPTMASLAVGIFLLAVLPTPLSAILLSTGSISDAIVLWVLSLSTLAGEVAMFLTLVYR
ncbi:hypothetical protein [Haloarchaeobius amylolyticus]|uniref:hypothetical protein n=1 Tax=Haloarchaeobius amylolyticus TaxID=1198296 RepID=UPI00226E46C9|nr:hypothetical protein [Haloarchaeobius amylolyticus]